MNKYYILALVFALASSMRIPLLPEIQYALVLLLLYKGSTRKVFFVIIIALFPESRLNKKTQKKNVQCL